MNLRKRIFHKQTVTNFDELEEQASAAKYFLKNKRFKFIRDYLQEAMDEARNQILENRIRDVREEVTISDKLKRVFITPRKVQVDELVGAYKFIKKFFDDLEYMISLPEEVKKKAERGEIEIK